MPASSESESERTELPTIPTIREMNTWNMKKARQWVQQGDPDLLRGNNLEKFTKADIGGRAFLAFTVKNFQSYGLPLAVAVALKDLADEVNEEGKLLNQTASRKRNENEIDPPEPLISPKRNRQEDPLSKLATRAREQRNLIRKIITDLNSSSNQHFNPVHSLPGAVDKLSDPTFDSSSDQHSNSVDKLSDPTFDSSSDQHSNPVRPLPRAVDRLSDPTFERNLAFPFIGRVPVRFKLHNMAEGSWQYVGRTKFKKLVEDLENVREGRNHSAVWLYGTQGYGKSHLLAALVCYLAAQCERVVYIPDCREWFRDPIGYLQTAMLFAWADDITAQEEIWTKTTEDEIEAFIKRQDNIIFVVDQLIAFTAYNGSEEVKRKREELSQRLLRFTAKHSAVFSSSANYREHQEYKQRQSSYLMLPVHGGFNRTEMDQWWKRHSNIDISDDDRSDFEDITGRIPLLLDKCVMNGKVNLTADYWHDTYDKALSFVQQVRDREMGQPSRWKWYRDYVEACIRRESVPSGYNRYPELIDHRYFFHELDEQGNEQGNYTCGLVRNAVANQLLDEGLDFADTGYLARFIDNKSIAGFMIEHAVLSSLQLNGLSISENLRTSMKLRILRDPLVFNDDFTKKPVLYRPKKCNFKAVDGIILLIKDANKARKKLMMFPLKITLTPDTHADSRKMFFKEYGNWITDLSQFDVEVQFLWITPEPRDDKEYPAGPDGQPPKHLERYIPFKKVNKRLWEDYEDAMKKLEKKKAAKREPPKGTAAEGEPPKRRSDRLKQ